MIRIIGDSYSDDAYRVEGFTNTWVRVLAREFEIENCAVRGCANLDMLRKQVRDYTGPAIINLSALTRKPWQSVPVKGWDDSEATIYKLNTNAARKMIAQIPTAYFWSPFLDYKTWPEVDFIPLEWGNTMYDTRYKQLTVNFGKATVQDAGNHLTAEAHSWLVDHMRAVINKMILEKRHE